MGCKPLDPCYAYSGKLGMMSTKFAANRAIESPVIDQLQTTRSQQYRRRTVGEALARVQDAGSPLWKVGKSYPFTKPYAYLLQGLTYAMVLVDPLDRLEGGVID